MFSCLLIFSKSDFSKSSFRNTNRVSDSLDQHQAQHFVGPDLGPNCLQRLSADDTSRHKLKIGMVFRKVNYTTGLNRNQKFIFIIHCKYSK